MDAAVVGCPISSCTTPYVDLIIHTQIRAAPITAHINWQMPVKTIPARIEPVPGVATFIMMQDHARSRLKGRCGGRAINEIGISLPASSTPAEPTVRWEVQ